MQLTAALFASLGEPYPADCCVPKHAMPAPRLESMPASLTRSAPAIALFADNCGACHGHRTQVPPGFLHGDERTVAANLNACAERINYRLHMWTQPDEERVKSPMPPVPPAPHDERSWPASGALAELRAAARRLLTHSSEQSLLRLLGKHYDTLAACAPPVQ